LPIAGLWVVLRNGKYLEKLENQDLGKEDFWKIERINKMYRYLYSGFSVKFIYWEFMIVLRKTLMIAAGVFLAMASP
jgi:hypothetical protein